MRKHLDEILVDEPLQGLADRCPRDAVQGAELLFRDRGTGRHVQPDDFVAQQLIYLLSLRRVAFRGAFWRRFSAKMTSFTGIS